MTSMRVGLKRALHDSGDDDHHQTPAMAAPIAAQDANPTAVVAEDAPPMGTHASRWRTPSSAPELVDTGRALGCDFVAARVAAHALLVPAAADTVPLVSVAQCTFLTSSPESAAADCTLVFVFWFIANAVDEHGYVCMAFDPTLGGFLDLNYVGPPPPLAAEPPTAPALDIELHRTATEAVEPVAKKSTRKKVQGGRRRAK